MVDLIENFWEKENFTFKWKIHHFDREFPHRDGEFTLKYSRCETSDHEQIPTHLVIESLRSE